MRVVGAMGTAAMQVISAGSGHQQQHGIGGSDVCSGSGQAAILEATGTTLCGIRWSMKGRERFNGVARAYAVGHWPTMLMGAQLYSTTSRFPRIVNEKYTHNEQNETC